MTALARRVSRLMNAETTAAHAEAVTTEQIADTLRHPTDGRLNHAVENARPLRLPHRDDLPIPPYTLGVWLGDGHSRDAQFTSADPRSSPTSRPRASRCTTSAAHALRDQGAELPPLPSGDASCAVTVHSRARVPERAAIAASRAKGRRRRDRGRCVACGKVPEAGWHELDAVRPATVATGRSSVTCVPPACSATSTSRRRTCGRPRRSAGPCWPGCWTPTGPWRRPATFSSASPAERLAEGVRELVVSLGYRCSMTTKRGQGPHGGVVDGLHPELLDGGRGLPPRA